MNALPRVGGRLGRYELISVLGHGAMASVFRARDTRLQREVALKVMNLTMAARKEGGERFRREAQAVAAVKHPGIVEIFDFVAATEDEPAYIVSELIEGPTLREFLDQRRGRLLPEAAALLALPVAEALAVAHARGIVHRDVKPDNVMIDRGCRVVLTDFGVAQITGLETMTATGAIVGSPAYMSPEQARGQDLGPASDLWALGVLLYEMATGHMPFAGKDPLIVLGAITRGQFKRPSQVSPYAGPEIDRIVGQCLKSAPGERYSDAQALAEDLRAFLRASGLANEAGSLRQLIASPEPFEAELRPRLADAAVAAARRHTRRGELARALAELSRATAYVPGHGEAAKLVRRISAGRRWITVAGGVVTIGSVAAALAFAWPRVGPTVTRAQEPAAAPGTPSAGPSALAKEAVPPAVAVKEPSRAEVVPAPATVPSTGVSESPKAPVVAGAARVSGPLAEAPAPQKRPNKRARRPGPETKPPSPGPEVPEPTVSAPAAAGASVVPEAPTTPAPEPPPPAPPTAAPAPPAKVRVELGGSSNGFCFPTLGSEGYVEKMARELEVEPGTYAVNCWTSRTDKLAVGTVTLTAISPGQRWFVRVVKDKSGVVRPDTYRRSD